MGIVRCWLHGFMKLEYRVKMILKNCPILFDFDEKCSALANCNEVSPRFSFHENIFKRWTYGLTWRHSVWIYAVFR